MEEQIKGVVTSLFGEYGWLLVVTFLALFLKNTTDPSGPRTYRSTSSE